MANQRKQHSDQTRSETAQEQEERMRATEDEPAVDRGDRIATGKAIARGGRSSGFVPGAQPQPRKDP